jgi:flagellar P-ring protein precursor FlgI
MAVLRTIERRGSWRLWREGARAPSPRRAKPVGAPLAALPSVGRALRARNAAAYVVLVLLLPLLAFLVGMPRPAQAARIKDIAEFEGVRSNQLSGYGIVVGLQGTGDGQQALFTIQSILSALRRNGVLITVDPRQIRVKNAAAVLVTAKLPPFARSGDHIDVQVSSIGDAKSLQGGTLITAPLRGGDQQVYAVAQGPVSLGGGFSASAPGASTQSGMTTAGIIPNGALVEKELAVDLAPDGKLKISLHQPDITTASRVAEAINLRTRTDAMAIDPKTVEVTLREPGAVEAMNAMTQIEVLQVALDAPAKVVINERTGTVIMGQEVRIAPVAVAHGTLQVEIKTDYGVSQPNAFSAGQTVVVPDSQIVASEGAKHSLAVLPPGVTLGQLVNGLNLLGVTPQDLIAVLEAIKTSGALQADLEIM